MRAGRFFFWLIIVAVGLSLVTGALAAPGVLKLGDRGAAVEDLQENLRRLGYDPGPLDGIFGPKTQAAVKAFQSKERLVVDGLVGPKTTAALTKALAAKKEPTVPTFNPMSNPANNASNEKTAAGSSNLGERIHIVQKGETLYRIAKNYGVSLEALVKRNQLADPSRIKVGQRLIIPSVTAQPVVAENQETVVYPGQGTAGGGGKTWGKIALTFDDGPDPANLPKILDTLKRYQAKATFFVIGNLAERNPDLLAKIVAAGHEVGNHSYSHPVLADLDRAGLQEEVKKSADLIERLTGKRPAVFRPPYGFVSNDLQEVVRAQGEKIVLWSNLGSWDFPERKPEELANLVGDFAFDGAIVMLHETMATTAEALPLILDRLKKKGLEPVTVSQLLAK